MHSKTKNILHHMRRIRRPIQKTSLSRRNLRSNARRHSQVMVLRKYILWNKQLESHCKLYLKIHDEIKALQISSQHFFRKTFHKCIKGHRRKSYSRIYEKLQILAFYKYKYWRNVIQTSYN